LELVLKTLRTMALPALMKVVSKINHMTTRPIQALSASTARENRSKLCMTYPLGARDKTV
jgi:hypothetical protein